MGSNMVRRGPGKGHIWHTDIESSAVDGRFVSVWIGLENTSQSSALHLISRSHQFGRPIQQVAQERGRSRDEITDEMVVAWAHEHDSHAKLVQPQVSDGQPSSLMADFGMGRTPAGDAPAGHSCSNMRQPRCPLRFQI